MIFRHILRRELPRLSRNICTVCEVYQERHERSKWKIISLLTMAPLHFRHPQTFETSRKARQKTRLMIRLKAFYHHFSSYMVKEVMPDLKARQPCHLLRVQEWVLQMSTKSFNLRRVCIMFVFHYLAIDNFAQKRTRPNVSVSRRSWRHAPSRQGRHSLVMPEAS